MDAHSPPGLIRQLSSITRESNSAHLGAACRLRAMITLKVQAADAEALQNTDS